MLTKSPRRISLAALFALAAIGTAGLPAPALADGINPDGNGGALCKGKSFCNKLQASCKGKYTDATQTDGTVYGKCSKTAQIAPNGNIKLRTN